MNLLDDEVLAVILALLVVGSALGIAELLRPRVTEPFTAIGLLNENCKIGNYPETVINNTNITLCIFLYNYMGYPVLLQVRYKIGTNETIPSTNTSSPEPVVMNYTVALDHGENYTFKVSVPVRTPPGFTGEKVALIFELWMYDPGKGDWTYTGRWTHLYVKVTEAAGL